MSDNPKGYDETLTHVYRFLSIRPRSEAEMRQYLNKRHATGPVQEKIMEFLLSQNLINDHDFTAWWIDQRTKFRPKGKRFIEMELKQKGIPQDIIDSHNIQTQTQLDTARKLIEQKLPRYSNLPKREIYQKLSAHLQRRGFDWDTIKRSIDDSLKDRV